MNLKHKDHVENAGFKNGQVVPPPSAIDPRLLILNDPSPKVPGNGHAGQKRNRYGFERLAINLDNDTSPEDPLIPTCLFPGMYNQLSNARPTNDHPQPRSKKLKLTPGSANPTLYNPYSEVEPMALMAYKERHGGHSNHLPCVDTGDHNPSPVIDDVNASISDVKKETKISTSHLRDNDTNINSDNDSDTRAKEETTQQAGLNDDKGNRSLLERYTRHFDTDDAFWMMNVEGEESNRKKREL